MLLSAVRRITKDVRVVCLGLTNHVRPLDALIDCRGISHLQRAKRLVKSQMLMQSRDQPAYSMSVSSTVTGWPIGTPRWPFLHSSSMQNPPRRLTIWCTMTDLREYPRSSFQLQLNTLEASYVLFYSPHKVCDYFQRYQTVVTDSRNWR